jgi:hypothetical protein
MRRHSRLGVVLVSLSAAWTLAAAAGSTAGTAAADPAPCAGALDLSPATAVNTVGTTHVLTLTVTASTCPGTTAHIVFQVRGTNTIDSYCDATFDVGSQCTFGYVGNQPGSDVITAFVDENYNGRVDPGEPLAVANKIWVPVLSGGPGRVSGGGQTDGVDTITFAVHGASTSTRVSGGCTVVDHTTGTKVTCLDATAVLVTGNHATLTGHAKVDGTPTTYRIDVVDGGEPDQGRDSFQVTTATGYTAGGQVTKGDVQVRSS